MAGQLEAARARERDFLMSVGHDLRTPLTTIRGYAEALDGGRVDADDLERVAAVLHTQTDRLSRLIEDFMLLARLEAREFTFRPERVDLAAHVKEIADGYLTRADAAYVRVELDLEDVGRVMVDPDRISQICGNLLDNAFRYTPEGGIVRVGLQRLDGQVRLAVEDSGPGITAEDLPRVFDRLYVAQRYRPIRPEGSGLGLSIVHELVEAMDGQVSVQSALGRGSIFAVVLPVRSAS
jgi:signal transduction histidine kinase